MQRLEVSDAVRPIYGSLGVKPLIKRVRITIAFKYIDFQRQSSVHWQGEDENRESELGPVSRTACNGIHAASKAQSFVLI